MVFSLCMDDVNLVFLPNNSGSVLSFVSNEQCVANADNLPVAEHVLLCLPN